MNYGSCSNNDALVKMCRIHHNRYFCYQEPADNSVSFDGGTLESNEKRHNKNINKVVRFSKGLETETKLQRSPQRRKRNIQVIHSEYARFNAQRMLTVMSIKC